MPSFVPQLNEHVRRLSRREIRAQVAGVRKSAAYLRREVARLKRDIAGLRKLLSRVGKTGAGASISAASASVAQTAELDNIRFSAKSVRSQRKRLGLSAAEFGKLVGVSQLTVYHWEHGKARPRAKKMAALVAVRQMGRRDAQARLASIK